MNSDSLKSDGGRSILPLDEAGWRWTPGRPRHPGAGEPITLPHSWTAAEEYIPGVAPRRGWATYSLDVDIPRLDPDREWRLRCKGFHGTGAAWINGRSIGRFNGDYLGIDLEASRALREGRNQIVLHVSNRYSRHVLPAIPDPDFHPDGGLGGGMHLAALPRIRLSKQDCHVLAHADRPGELDVEVGMLNHGEMPVSASVQIEIRDPEGRVVAVPEPVQRPLSPDQPARSVFHCSISAPRLWNPDDPALYSIEAALLREGRVCDRISWSFGLRTARFDPVHGFTLNGKTLPLRGVNRHENLPGFGSALPRALHESDARQIKEMGLNFVRLSHYPQSSAFLDACDRLGILVYAEVCSWKKINGGPWLSAAKTQLERMIRRDRHHPSIILWGLGNEGRHRKAYLRLKELARSLDPSRPTIYAENHAYRARRKNTAGLTDVWGLNYEFDAMDSARSAAPTGCVVVSECANLPYARRGHWASEVQQVHLIRAAIERTEAAGPGAAGWALWGFADYATPRRQRWFRECGVIDGWRADKMAAVWLRARFSPVPLLRVFGDWSFASGSMRRIRLVTNCADVRMIRADGTEEPVVIPRPDLYEMDVHFDGHPLRFSGRRADGTTVETALLPWKEPAAFELQADAPLPGTAPAARPVFRCALQVRDDSGVSVLAYEGEAQVSLPPGARASLIGGQRIPVHGGQASFFVEIPRTAAELRIECALDDFPPQSLRLSSGTPTGGRP